MRKARKLNGQPSVMVPAALFLDLARCYQDSRNRGGKFYVDLAGLEAKAYRKVREAARASTNQESSDEL